MDIIRTSKSKYEVYIGCTEWQESYYFDTLKEAYKYIEDWKSEHYTIGLYTADEGWILNLETNEHTDIEIRWD